VHEDLVEVQSLNYHTGMKDFKGKLRERIFSVYWKCVDDVDITVNPK
jgi:hypothetical protein